MLEERYVETMEMLAATVAHEVKNPLAMIRINVDYIELCDTEKKYEKNYNIIRKELNKTNEMILDFVNLVRPIGKLDEKINAWEVTQKVIGNFISSYGNSITIQTGTIDEKLCFIGNAHLFSLVVSNTIKNASEAIETTGIIRIRIMEKDGFVYLTFQDNGCGLDRNTLNKINTGTIYTTKQYGSGLGITICKKIMEAHQGQYFIENSDHGGCIVQIIVPKITDVNVIEEKI